MSAWDKMQSVAKAVGSKVEEVSDAAQSSAHDVAAKSASAAFARALDALDEAVGQIRRRRPSYEVTVQVTIGPVSLGVTLPGDGVARTEVGA